MKTLIITMALVFTTVILNSQTECDPPTGLTSEVSLYDVKLTWNPPVSGTHTLKESILRKNIPEYSEAYEIQNIFSFHKSIRDYLDLQFYWETYHNNGESGIACDGQNFYTTTWNDVYIFKYDLNGNFLDTITFEGVSKLRNLVYCETDGYFYGATVQGPQGIYILDFENDTVIDHISITTNMGCRALGYNKDLDVFYTNNWSSDILVVDRVSRSVIDTVPLTGTFSSYYGFAYDNISDGGPYVWGFSQDNHQAELVQMTLPDFTETGTTIDVNSLVPDSLMAIAGGLYVQYGLVDTTVTLGGYLQNSIVFGLELGGSTPPPPVISGYNIYRENIQINSSAFADTVYYDLGLDAGIYNYYVTALYSDTSGNVVCESDPSNTVQAEIYDPDLILGGNVFAGSSKLINGMAHAYSFTGEDVIHESSVEIDDLGYYFFFPFVENYFYVSTTVNSSSTFSESYIQTYYGDVYHWEDSPLIHLQNNLYNQDINLVELEPYSTGGGSISGNIAAENKAFVLAPASDVLILLLNDQEKVIDWTNTDENGNYSFSNLGYGTYMILCEIIGKSMDPKLLSLNASSSSINELNFVIQNDQVVIGIDELLPSSIAFVSDMYPNPASITSSIDIISNKEQEVYLRIKEIDGQLIDNELLKLSRGNNKIIVDLSEISSGIMLIELEFKSGSSIVRKIIVTK